MKLAGGQRHEEWSPAEVHDDVKLDRKTSSTATVIVYTHFVRLSMSWHAVDDRAFSSDVEL